jgi:Amiloride-sensitive sodium channel.
LSKEQRQCLFEDEQTLKIANSNASGYSYSNCLVQCRLEHMDELCHCSPYFYPTGGSQFVDLTGHIVTKYCCEMGHSVASLSV